MKNVILKLIKFLNKLSFGLFSKYKIYYIGEYDMYSVVYKRKHILRKDIPDIVSKCLLEENVTLKPVNPERYLVKVTEFDDKYPSTKDSLVRGCFIKKLEDARNLCEIHREYLKWYKKRSTIRFIDYG